MCTAIVLVGKNVLAFCLDMVRLVGFRCLAACLQAPAPAK